MNIKEYIDSGVIEDYCLGALDAAGMQSVAQNAALYVEVRDEIEAYETALAKYATEFSTGKKQQLKQSLFSAIDNLESELHITADNIPLINKYSDAASWLRFVKPLLPAALEAPFLIHDLPDKGDAARFIVWSHGGIPDETHTHAQETFLILEGRCRCFIGDEVVELGAGDFLSIPLHVPHNVEILDGPVMAVIQRVKVA